MGQIPRSTERISSLW